MDLWQAPYCTEAKVRNGCLSTEQRVIDATPPTSCTAISQGLVLGCLATDSVSAEGATDVSPLLNKSCRDAWTFAGVRACEVCSCAISWASCCHQASRASAHTCIASSVIFTPGRLSCRTLCKYESQPWLLLPGTFLRLLPDSLALGTAVAGDASAIRSQQEQVCANVCLWLTALQAGFSTLQPTELLYQACDLL